MQTHWLASFLLALLLHLGLAAVFFQPAAEQPGNSISTGDGEGGIEVGLGTAGSYIDAFAPPEKPKTVSPKPAEPKLEINTNTPKQPTSDVVVAPRNIETSPQQVGNVNSPSPEQQQPNAIALQKASGQAQQETTGSRNIGRTKNYFSLIKSQLNQHKVYPTHLKKRKIQGVVVVRFTINALGEIQKKAIKKSSGNIELDNAALNVLAMANPLPPIPSHMQRNTLTLSLPVDYSLITN